VRDREVRIFWDFVSRGGEMVQVARVQFVGYILLDVDGHIDMTVGELLRC
jgi:hypothetical protein